nr:uro-adherence factor A-like [Ipomoea batatas]
MEPGTPLDYALFQLSPKRTRCELFVSTDGKTEKLASGLLKPFVTHLKVAEQVSSAAQSIKLDAGGCKDAHLWFRKGTLERFVRFVSTPEVLELVNSFDVEMSQLESARKIYSQGMSDDLSGSGESGSGVTAAADATKKELLRAIDVRLTAVQQNLLAACSRAASAGFNLDTVSELKMFADQFGAGRLNEACTKFIASCERRPEIMRQWQAGADDLVVRTSYGSDMSIDDEPITPPNQLTAGSHPTRRDSNFTQQQQRPRQPDQSNTSTSQHQQQPRSSSDALSLRRSRESSVEPEEKSAQSEPIPASQPMRRLSVQDRINMFESKQKENVGSGAKAAAGKPEIRRLSSDVSSAPSAVEKAVLRRWSGVSDMSIDLSFEKRDDETPLCTPSSASVSQSKHDDQNRSGLTDRPSSSSKPEFVIVPPRVKDSRLKDSESREEVVGSDPFTLSNKVEHSKSVETDGLKGQTWPNLIATQSEDNSLKEKTESEGQFTTSSWDKTNKAALATWAKFKTTQSSDEAIGTKSRTVHQTQTANSLQEQFGSSDNLGDQSSLHLQSKTTQRTSGNFGWSESGSVARVKDTWAPHKKGTEGDSSIEGIKKNEVAASSEKVDGSSTSTFGNAGNPIMRFKNQAVGAEVIKRPQDLMKQAASVSENKETNFSVKRVREAQEGFGSFSTPPAELAQRLRQAKGNQELNDELKMKANELEKLFAEHKQRVPGDQLNPSRRNRPVEIQNQPQASLLYRNPVTDNASVQLPDKYMLAEPAGSSSDMIKSETTPMMRIADNHGHTDALNENFSELSLSESSRGKFYKRYMQIRDAKLREEWNSRGAEKEARLKAMQDRLEKSRTEMKAKFSGSADKDDSISSTRRRTERLRLYNSRSLMKREKQHLDFERSDKEAITEFPEWKQYVEGSNFNVARDASFEDDVSRSAQVKKLLPSKSSSSSTPRTSAVPVPRSAVKTSNSNLGRRRFHSENPLTQSVPNFSDMRKENAKPSSAAGKTTRLQSRSNSHSKSTREEISIKEDKSRRPQSLRKSTVNVGEFRETTVLNSEDVLTPLKVHEEIQNKHTKTVDSKPFHKRNKSTDFSSRVDVSKQKVSRAPETMNSDEEYEDAIFEPEDPMNAVKDEEDEEFESMITEHNSNLENGDARLSHESEESMDFGSENGDLVRSFAHIDPSLAAELPAIVPSELESAEHVENSPAESPVSWNSRSHHPFSYPHEMPDVDASVDSSMGSPTSWNSHSLSQTEVDAARMRKKWGTAQKPMLVVNSSQNQSRKDVTRGFRRLLKFGRKNRGMESFVDRISATTSEGDDDTEDGRDPSNQSSEDLRKSRMGFPLGHPSDDNFSENEFFSGQVQSLQSSIPAPPANFKLTEDHLSGSSLKAPRSFFSLSTFRSKGSDSKIR